MHPLEDFKEYLGVMAVRDEDGTSPPPRTEGYKREETEYGELIRIEINANRASDLFSYLSTLFRGPVVVLLEAPSEVLDIRETWQSKLLPAAKALEMLKPYFFRLFHDGNLAFGFGAPNEMEIFVTEHKIFRIYASEPDRVEGALRSYGLKDMPGKVFADEVHLYALLDLNVVPRLYRDVLRDPRDLSFLEEPTYHHREVARAIRELFDMSVMDESEEDSENDDDELDDSLSRQLEAEFGSEEEEDITPFDDDDDDDDTPS